MSHSYKPQLDGLRAIAVTAVLIHHFLPVNRLILDDFHTLGLLAVRLLPRSERLSHQWHPSSFKDYSSWRQGSHSWWPVCRGTSSTDGRNLTQLPKTMRRERN